MCNKVAFESKKEAQQQVKMLQATRTGKHRLTQLKKQHAYECPYCGCWHTSSMSPKQYKRSNKNK